MRGMKLRKGAPGPWRLCRICWTCISKQRAGTPLRIVSRLGRCLFPATCLAIACDVYTCGHPWVLCYEDLGEEAWPGGLGHVHGAEN